MNITKERIIGAITVMSDDAADKLWHIISTEFVPSWDNIKETEPDEWDLQMLEDIKNNPDCKEMVLICDNSPQPNEIADRN